MLEANCWLLSAYWPETRAFCVACLLAFGVANAAMADPGKKSTAANSQAVDGPIDLAMDNPGSIVGPLKQDEKRKDYLFQIPIGDEVFKSWADLRTELDRKYGFKPGIAERTASRAGMLRRGCRRGFDEELKSARS